MKRKLVAVLACRHSGSRLFGKPFQNLDIKSNTKVIDNLIGCLKKFKFVSNIVLAVSKGNFNKSFISYAILKNIKSVIGNEKDVLSRLVKAGVESKASDILRVSSESPFLFHEILEAAWTEHKIKNNDFTTADNVIDGVGFEIIKLDALKYSHKFGRTRHKSEFCSLFIRENPDKFKCQKLSIDKKFDRRDIRLTIDYPEDLILCREIYKKFKKKAPLINIKDIISYLDKNKKLILLTKKYTKMGYQTLNKWN
jgi:spore coat polysaccharide biosynthesis protein SpsF